MSSADAEAEGFPVFDIEKMKALAAQFQSHSASQGLDQIEQAGLMMQEAAAEVVRLQSEYAKSERRALTFGDYMHHQILVMRAAVVDGHLRSHAHGLQWIYNTLEGPGHIPDLDEAKAMGGAQALFDKEVAEQEAFRTAHPAP
jgi:hypothetical protein